MDQRSLLKSHSILLLAFMLCLGIMLPVAGSPMLTTIIQGRISNFEDANDLPAVELINYMPFNTDYNVNSQFIESDGAFRFEFEQLYPKGIMIKFKDMFVVYASPGDSINLTIDARILSDTSNSMFYENKYIRIECPGQRFQDEYQSFRQAFYSNFYTREDRLALQEAQTKLDHSAYTEYVRKRTLKHNAYLEEYIEATGPGKELQGWAADWIYLQELSDLIRYAWLHPMYNKLDRKTFRLPDEYYGFLKDERHNNEELMVSGDYPRFLHGLYMHLHREFGHSEMQSQFDSLYKAGNGSEAYRLRLTHILDNSSGFEQEYFASKFFSSLIFWKFIDGYKTLYKPSIIGRDDFNQILAMEYAELEKLISEPVYAKDLNLHDSSLSEKELVFKTLPVKFPDKVIYVDFWAPWCGPCMAEMPKSKELQEKLEGRDVVFVFLASKCTETSWKATIAQKQLSGEHYLLMDKEYALLADKFNITGIPRYMVIDKKGMVVNDNAPRPSDESLEGLLIKLCSK